MAELARPLLWGLLLAALLITLFPPGYLARFVPQGPWQYVIMLLSGIPVYMCSTGSLPLAYGFYLQGFSPGSLLVFLLSGPATNVTSLVIIRQVLGVRVWALYLFGLSSFSLLAGLLVDQFSPPWMIRVPEGVSGELSWFNFLCAVFLGILVIKNLFSPKKGCS
jgi:uncharacterized membrane protein YraQ (UPF0718 family)